MIIDTHAHLTDEKFDSDRADALARAQTAGLQALVEIGESPERWDKALAFARSQPFLYCTLGIHPHHAKDAKREDWEKLRFLSADPKVKAIGEIGLDYFRNESPQDVQRTVFEKALTLARDAQKPVVVHSREAHEDMLSVLKNFFPKNPPVLSGVLHCFQGSWEWAQEILARGFCLGFDGPITYPKSDGLRDVLQRMPQDRILLETDCPYLPPQAYRGKRNEPAYLALVAEEAAKVRGLSIEELGRITTENAKRLFKIP